MTEPPRVVFLINSLEGGGAERVLSIILDVFQGPLRERLTFAPEVVLLDDAPRRYALPSEVPVQCVGANGSLWRSLWAVTREMRRRRADVVVSFLARANFAGVVSAMWNGHVAVVSERVNTTHHFGGPTLRHRISRWLTRLLYPRADLVIAVSNGVAADLVERFGVDRRRVAVVYNPYLLADIRRQGAATPSVDLPARFIVSAGRLTANKNFDLLLQAYADAGLEEALVILGTGEREADLRARARALGIAARVWFLGFVADPYSIVARARAFVSTSNVEGFPNAAAEAMVLGRPVAMTDCPSGPAELLGGTASAPGRMVEARYGILAPVGDRAAMTQALRAIVSPAMRAYGPIGARRMEALAADAIALEYADLVAKAAAAGRRTPAAASPLGDGGT